MVSIEETLIGRPEDKDALRDFFQRYGFKTMLRELGPGNAASRRGAPAKLAGRRGRTPCRHADHQGRVRTVTTMEQLDAGWR
jgi:DNA polymerase-1